MRNVSILAAVLATALATTALAAPTLPGINVRWDNCFADGGVVNKSFACDTNTGAELAVLSVQLDNAMVNVSGMEIRVSFRAAAPTLPAWWGFDRNAVNPGTGCRGTSLAFIPSPTLAAGSCLDWGQGAQSGGIGRYGVDELGPGSAVLIIASAVPQTALVPQLDPATEYIVGGLRINHAKTVGTGSCGGCDIPVCILFTSLDITTPNIANDRLFTAGANGVSSQIINWQNGQLTGLVNHCNGTFDCDTQFQCLAAAPVAARRSTWGQVKSLYR